MFQKGGFVELTEGPFCNSKERFVLCAVFLSWLEQRQRSTTYSGLHPSILGAVTCLISWSAETGYFQKCQCWTRSFGHVSTSPMRIMSS